MMKHLLFHTFLGLALCKTDVDVLKIDGVVIHDTGSPMRIHQMKSAHDKYDAEKGNQGKYKFGEVGGANTDIFVESNFISKAATITGGSTGVENFISRSPAFRGITSGMSKKNIQILAESLEESPYVNDMGVFVKDFVMVADDHRKVTVMMIAIKKDTDDKDKTDFRVMSLTEEFKARDGLIWGKTWNNKPENQDKVGDWCAYRLLKRLAKHQPELLGPARLEL